MLVCVDTIYVDSLFALNLIADYLLLIVGARVAGAVIRRWRIAIAAVVGAAYAVAAVVPEWGFLTRPLLKIALGVGMCLIAYGSERTLWRCSGMFFAVSALFGGAVWAAGMLAGGYGASALYVPVSWRVLVLSFAVCYAAVTLLPAPGGAQSAALLCTAGRHPAWKDGHAARAGRHRQRPRRPRVRAPVMVCGPAPLAPLTGAVVPPADAAGAVEALSRVPGLAGRVLLLPYRAVGTSSGCSPPYGRIRSRWTGHGGRAGCARRGLGADYEAVAPGRILKGGRL